MNAVVARAVETLKDPDADRDVAIAQVRRALVDKPADLELRIVLGALLGGTADSAEAIAILEPTLAGLRSEKHPRILAVLALSYDYLGRKADAIAACRKAIAIEGQRVGTVLTLARLLGETGEHDESLTSFRWLVPRVKPQLRGTVDQAIAQLEGWIAARPG